MKPCQSQIWNICFGRRCNNLNLKLFEAERHNSLKALLLICQILNKNVADRGGEEILMHLQLKPRQRSHSIKPRGLLLQLSIRQLSLGFKALAYHHLRTTVAQSAASMAINPPRSGRRKINTFIWERNALEQVDFHREKSKTSLHVLPGPPVFIHLEAHCMPV